jgi:DNA-binding MarR family transcriptional regulator
MTDAPRRTIDSGPTPRDSIDRVVAGWAAARPELDVSPIGVIARLTRVNALVRDRVEDVFTRHGLTAAGFSLLATLVRLGHPHAATAARLREELGIASSHLAELVASLAASGLVRRSAGRDAQVELTPEGLVAFEACAPEHLATERELLATLTEDERDALAILLRKLLVSLEAA